MEDKKMSEYDKSSPAYDGTAFSLLRFITAMFNSYKPD